jgi:hypothetical protein
MEVYYILSYFCGNSWNHRSVVREREREREINTLTLTPLILTFTHTHTHRHTHTPSVLSERNGETWGRKKEKENVC